MTTETEVKFLQLEHDALRLKLREAGAVCVQPMRLMRRAILDYPDRLMQHDRDAFVRVRDEGDKITLTYKQFDHSGIGGAKEIELLIQSFEEAIKLLEAIGLKVFSRQESRRETWQLNEAEVVLDEWPFLKPYIEIESEHEDEIRKTAATLGLDWGQAAAGDVMVAYRAEYPHLALDDTVGNVPLLTFDGPLPELLRAPK